jgi:hypothetical protein
MKKRIFVLMDVLILIIPAQWAQQWARMFLWDA